VLYWCQFHYLLTSHGQTTQILQKNRSPHTRNLITFNRNCNLTLLITWNGIRNAAQTIPNTHTHTHLTALFPGLLGWAGTRKVKPIRILLKQETVSGSGISWAICKFAPRSRQITMPAPHHSVFFTGRMPFLPPNQQCQSTEGTSTEGAFRIIYWNTCTLMTLVILNWVCSWLHWLTL